MVDHGNNITIKRQCELLKINRSSYYYQAVPVSDADLELMKLIDELHLQRPTLGSRTMVDRLEDKGHKVR